MKKIKIKPFLAFSSVFLIASCVFIPTQQKIEIKADNAIFDGSSNDIVYTDIMNFDWVRCVSVYPQGSISNVSSDSTNYNAVMSLPTNFLLKSDGSVSNSYYTDIYLYDRDFTDYVLVRNGSIISIDPINPTNDLLLYNINIQFNSLYTDYNNILYFYAPEIVIPNDYIDFLNVFNFSYFYIESYGGMYNFKNFISNATLTFTLTYYNYESKTLNYEDYFLHVDTDQYFITEDNTVYWAPFNNFLDFIDYGVINEWIDSTGYITLSDVYLKFDFNINDLRIGPPVLLTYKSFLVNSFEKPAIIDIYSNKIYYNPLPEIRVSDFITTAVSGFLDFSIIPGLSFGSILAIMLAIPIVIAFLKYFVGG